MKDTLKAFDDTLKDTLKAFDDFKDKHKSEWGNVFFLYVQVYVFWKFIQYTIHWDKTQMLKKIPLDKINVIKNALFFLSRAPTHHSFTFNSRFLYELKYNVHPSKVVLGNFHFRFRFVFTKAYISVQQKAWNLWLENVLIPFRIKITERPQTLSQTSDFKVAARSFKI